jgi:hypothetical protein
VLAPARRERFFAASADGTHFATLGPRGSLQLESPGRCAELVPPSTSGWRNFPPDDVMFSADSSVLVARPPDGLLLRAWAADTGVELYGLRGDGLQVAFAAPLRDLAVTPIVAGVGPLSTAGLLVLDVRTAQQVPERASARPPPPEPRSSRTWLSTAETARGVSPDGLLLAVANSRGELGISRTRDGHSLGVAHFAGRHDFVRFVWFMDAHRVAVQTARGAVFEFTIRSSS